MKRGQQNQGITRAMISIEGLNWRIIRVESLLVILSVAAIAYADYQEGKSSSIGYLYLIPLSYSVLIHRLRTTLLLLAICLFLRDWFGPIELSPWLLILRDFMLAGIFLVVAWVLRKLGNDPVEAGNLLANAADVFLQRRVFNYSELAPNFRMRGLTNGNLLAFADQGKLAAARHWILDAGPNEKQGREQPWDSALLHNQLYTEACY